MQKLLSEGQKVGGYVLLETVLAMIAFSMLSMAFFTIFSGQFSMINSSRDAMQAQQYAEIDAQKLRLMNYYDLESEGKKTRSAMTSWDNPGNLWEDEITIGNEIVIDDYTQSKQRIATIKIYRKGDSLARFSFEVPLSSQGSGVPIGSIMAWGVDSNPSYDGGTYLECNGDTFDKNKYKRLYEVLGTNKLPNYQGMFLRGYGSQTVADDKARKIITSWGDNPSMETISEVTHSSANKVGGIQHDSLRPMFGALGHIQWLDFNKGDGTGYKNSGNLFHFDTGNNEPTSGASSFPYLTAANRASPYIINSLAENGALSDLSSSLAYDNGWYGALTKYEYEVKYNTSSDDEGNRFVSSVWLERKEVHPTLFFNGMHTDVVFDSSSAVPTTNEIRPANVAVKFMIKAK